MNLPKELLYSQSHEWVQFVNETTARIGLTDFAQAALGDIVFLNLPEVGDTLTKSETAADVESVKAVSDIFSPFTGTVSAINEDLLDAPEAINTDPYGTWLIEISDITDKEELLSAEQYEALCNEEG